MGFDLIIKDGMIVDGSGGESYVADIAISGEKIVCIGLGLYEADRTISAEGRIVSPGFIDMHTHSDIHLLADSRGESEIRQGVTMEVVGQCGYSAAPAFDPRVVETKMIGYHPSVHVDWRGLGEFLDRMEGVQPGINVGAMVGHGALRWSVMGSRRGSASREEISAMKDLLRQSLDEGAGGLTFGLEYEPGQSATTSELEALSAVVGEYDRLVSMHVRNRDKYFDMSLTEACAVARNAGVSMQISHINPKYGAPKNAMASAIDLIQAARASGVDIAMDVIPDVWGPTAMVSVLPPWALKGGIHKILDRLRCPEDRLKMCGEPKPIWQLVIDGIWDRIVLLHADPFPHFSGMTITEIAKEMNTNAFNAVFDILLAADSGIYNVLWAAENFLEEDIEQALSENFCGVISDCRTLSPDGVLGSRKGAPATYGWIPRYIRHYLLDRKILSLEEGLQRVTSYPARRLGLKDRGLLKPGYRADITIFDPNLIASNTSIKNLTAFPTGIDYVLLNGEVVVEKNSRVATGTGQVIRF